MMKTERPLWGRGIMVSPQHFQQQAAYAAWTAEVIARLGKDAAEVLTQMDTDTAETTEDAPNLTADGTKATEATEDTTGTQNGSQKATGAAKRNKTKSTD